jgi:hypothetical protein
MADEQDVILSEGDNEFLRLVRENRERRYNNGNSNSVNQSTENIASSRVDSTRDKGSKEGSGRVDDTEEGTEEKETTARKISKRVQAKEREERESEVVRNNERGTEEKVDSSSSEETSKESNPNEIEITENPLASTRSTKEENFKNLRNALKASNFRVSELETELKAKEEELKKLDSVSELEAQLQEANSKLEKLQKYEDIIGLYGTEGFKEEYYDRVDTIKSDIMDIAKDYGVEDSVIDQAIQITNQRQLNEFLGQYFDVYSVQDIRKNIKEIQNILEAREDAENNPVKTREYLLANFAKKKDAMDKQARENIKLASMSAWTEMSETYSNPTSGVDILQEKRGDKNHNDTREGILNTASQEFGKLMAMLTDNGLKSLPSNVARALASRFQLGEVAAYAIVQSEGLKKENDELKAELKKFTNYSRPLGNAGSSSAISGKNSQTSELKGKELTRYLFDKASQMQ